MSDQRTEFRESLEPLPRDVLLQRRIGDLRLQLKGTRLERLVERLYEELTRAGLTFHPPVYLSDEWGCPDRVPIIGVPFYLADPNLTRLEDELREGVEAESDDQIMRYLRHEAGHAFNYAYQLYDTQAWTDLFGPFARPYADDYAPNPFSRSYVRHLPAWYAQKHPDEDFAETFAVWLNPTSNWRQVYAEWPCMAKLNYVDELARRVGHEPPPVTAGDYDTQEEFLHRTVADFYRDSMPQRPPIAPQFDAALRDIFDLAVSGPIDEEAAKSIEPASKFLGRHRRAIVRTVYHWTGLSDVLVRGLVEHLQERCDALDLKVGRDKQAKLVETVAFVTTLCMNRIQAGDFVRK